MGRVVDTEISDVVDVVEKLMKILYPGYYSDKVYKIYSLNNNMSATIEDVIFHLKKQIMIVLNYCNKEPFVTEQELEDKKRHPTIGNNVTIYSGASILGGETLIRYLDTDKDKKHFSVSMQHYVFAVHAFVSVVKEFDTSKYVYSVYETRTDEVLNNVKNLKSEIGVISYSSSNEKVIKKLFREYHLKFVPLMVRDTYAYVWKDHPLADKKELSLKELEEYPCVAFDQSSESDFYLSEEALGDYDFNKLIKSNDRATSAELMSALNGYSIGTGNMTDSMALKDGFVSIKLKL